MTLSSRDVDRAALADGLPDLALLVRRDGMLLSHSGGTGVQWLRPLSDCSGRDLHEIWPVVVADLIKRLTRKAISDRAVLEAELCYAERCCEVQVTALSPDRAICVVRAPSSDEPRNLNSSDFSELKLERRGFLRRFKNSISVAVLSERPLAVAMICVDGVVDIARVIDRTVSDRVMTTAFRRVSTTGLTAAGIGPTGYMGQLGDELLVLVLETSCRETIEACVNHISAGLREPIVLEDAEFHLTPYAGVAILGRDTTSPKLLLEHARACASEARRSGSPHACFFSDTLKLRSLARIDVTRELRDAIETRAVKLRYIGRHDLESGRLVAVVAYLQWIDPLRGEVRPGDFLTIAEATGLSAGLSRSMLACLQDDFAVIKPLLGSDVRISFGALRHHVLSDSFLADIRGLLANGVVTPDRLELRIAERTYVSREVKVWQSLADCGVQLVVDEFGRQVSSLDLLARVPLWGLQLDRSWVTAIDSDAAARKVCAAVVNVATGLGLTPIAAGIDSPAQRDVLLKLGCRQGLGDLYEPLALEKASTTAVAGT